MGNAIWFSGSNPDQNSPASLASPSAPFMFTRLKHRSSLTTVSPGSVCTWTAVSDLGLKRQNNEDSWGVFLLSDGRPQAVRTARVELPGAGLLLILSDGMGGTQAGEEASRFCVEQVAMHLATTRGWGKLSKAMRKALVATHAALLKRGGERQGWLGMGATLSVLWLLPNGRMALGHVGDSRIYRRRRGKMEQLTEDHSVGAGMVRRGELTEEAATRLKFRSLLEQAMGGDGAPIFPQISEAEWKPGDGFVLCSDGLYGPLKDRLEVALAAALEDGSEHAAADLIASANAAGGPDNITVILARLMPEATA